MRLFGWVQNKLNGKPVNKKPNSSVPATNQIHTKQEPREEFSDWPHGLLAIGTFGNTNSEIKQENENNIKENPSSSLEEEIVELTAEEVGKLQKELTKLLSRKPNKEKEIADLPLDRFLNCPSSLEVDRRISNALINNCNESEIDHHKLANEEEEEENIERTISVIIGKCKDICAEKNKKAIGKKSIAFLLKKMFVCRSGFAPAPCLRDTLQESRMEKILRMILQKKMNAQNSSRPASSTAKKYLEDNKQMPKKSNNHDQDHEKKEKSSDEGCKWVKTDSEYIVLEM